MTVAITYQHTHMRHKSGTKDYDVVVVKSPLVEGAVVIKRWGKIGTTGQITVESYAKKVMGNLHYSQTVDKKQKNGYVIEGAPSSSGEIDDNYSVQQAIEIFYNDVLSLSGQASSKIGTLLGFFESAYQEAEFFDKSDWVVPLKSPKIADIKESALERCETWGTW